jgi:hypothetical protein
MYMINNWGASGWRGNYFDIMASNVGEAGLVSRQELASDDSGGIVDSIANVSY